MGIDVKTTPNRVITVANTSAHNSVVVWYMENEIQEGSLVLDPGDSATITVNPNQLAALQELSDEPTDPLVISKVEATIESALSGDLVLAIAPEFIETSAATIPGAASEEDAFTRKVTVTLKNSLDEVHTWFTGPLPVLVEDTSVAGTASIDIETTEMVNGEAEIVVTYDKQDWLAGETATVTIEDMVILGYIVSGGASVDTIAE